jgi:hypothetical protein
VNFERNNTPFGERYVGRIAYEVKSSLGYAQAFIDLDFPVHALSVEEGTPI